MAVKSIPKNRVGRKRIPIAGLGINDMESTVATLPGEGELLYMKWAGIFWRCYSPKCHEKYPSYMGCTVAEDWYLFSAFYAWAVKRTWKGLHLDKDFLTDSKIYGPDTCVFIPGWLNNLFLRPRRPPPYGYTGVSLKDGRYQARLYIKGTETHIGMFGTPIEAAKAYLKARRLYVESRYVEIELIDPRLVDACERKLRHLEKEQGLD
jgi:hypothetical protein